VIKKLKIQLRLIKKENGITNYLLEIKKIIGFVVAISVHTCSEDHIGTILDGLPKELNGFATSIISRVRLCVLQPKCHDSIVTRSTWPPPRDN